MVLSTHTAYAAWRVSLIGLLLIYNNTVAEDVRANRENVRDANQLNMEDTYVCVSFQPPQPYQQLPFSNQYVKPAPCHSKPSHLIDNA